MKNFTSTFPSYGSVDVRDARGTEPTVIAPAPLSTMGKSLVQSSFKADDPEEKYTRWADTYDIDSLGALGFASPSICRDSVLRVWPRDGSHAARNVFVIDAGCGTGEMARLLRQSLGPETGALHGFDLTQAMLRKARERGLYASLQQGSMEERWPFHGAVADVVMCNGVLLYIKNTMHCLREFVRVTKKGGYCVMMVREDNWPLWKEDFEELVVTGVWKIVHASEPQINFLHLEERIFFRIYTCHVL